MATSGITVWAQTRDQIINAALRKCQILSEGESASSTQITDAALALNNLVAEYRALGMPLWKRYDMSITPIDGQQDYEIGVGQEINTPYPLKLLQARLLLGPNRTYINLNILADYDFNKLPITSEGIPVSVSYVPRIDYGILSVWPIPDASVPSTTTIVLTYSAPTNIYNAGTDDSDFPAEWFNALIYGLASLLGDEYALPIPDKQWLEKQSERHLATALSNGTEDGSLFFSPDSHRQ